jgi:glutathione peroxidase
MQSKFAAFMPVLLGTLLIGIPLAAVEADETQAKSVYDFAMKNIDGKIIPLSTFKGKAVLIVNVASQCGYTPQYKGLEALYRRYKDRGLVILAFPANNFGQQEPGSDEEIKAFCTTKYNVTFDMFSKISVKGADQHPLYRFLTSPETNPKFSGDVRWNFQKYLFDRSGKIIAKFASGVEPLSDELTSAIEQALVE